MERVSLEIQKNVGDVTSRDVGSHNEETRMRFNAEMSRLIHALVNGKMSAVNAGVIARWLDA
jgi:hypothetical protein